MHNQVASIIIFQTENFSGRRLKSAFATIKICFGIFYMDICTRSVTFCSSMDWPVLFSETINSICTVLTVTLDAALVMATVLVRSNHISRLELSKCFCSIIDWGLQNDLILIIRDGAGLAREDCLGLKGESAGHWIQFSSQFHQCNCVTGRTRTAPHILLLQASPPAAAPGAGAPTTAPSNNPYLVLVLDQYYWCTNYCSI